MSSPREFLDSLEQFGIKLGLHQIRAMLVSLGHPEQAYRSISIAGTNGKGSVTAMLERGLRAAGYRTGRYTSPHLVALEERFAVNGRDVAATELDAAIERVRAAVDRLPAPPSYFEATTAAGLSVFATAGIDVALLEVGLGGRLDATNAVNAIGSAITAIDLDHQEHLGSTLEAITREKAGVIKPGTFTVLSDNPPAVAAVVASHCQSVGADLILAREGVRASIEVLDGRARVQLRTPRRDYGELTPALRGRHQVQNAITAVRLLETLDERGHFRVSDEAVRVAVEDVSWPGRLEPGHVDGHPVLIDGAHNAGGAAALASFLRESFGGPVPIVLGVLRDKDADGIIAALLGVASRIVCTAPQSTRAIPPDELAARVASQTAGLQVDSVAGAREAISRAARDGAPVVVAGSLYLAGEVHALVS